MRYPVFRPPYVYRWAVLLTSLSTAVALGVAGVRALGADAQVAPVTPVAASSSAGTAAPSPVAAVPADLLSHTADPGRVVALTFDDGPHPEYTPQVLELLARYGAVATFCIVGLEAQRHPDLVRAVAAAGMGLCSHTMSHDETLAAEPDGKIEAEMLGCQRAIVAAAGAPEATVRYFRAPAGRWSERLRGIAAGNGMRSLGWSVDSRDWQRPGAAQVVASVQRDVRPGSVVLLHDGGGRRDQTVAALGELLPWLVDQGYRFVLPT